MHSPKQKIVVFSGAGVSAESGIQTFRDADGLWHNHNVQDICSIEGWYRNPELVLDFYNQRRKDIEQAKPNAAHYAIAELEQQYDVTVITQNIDDLHERAGSSRVWHVHGEATKARSSLDEMDIIDIGYKPIQLGDFCSLGSQLRPHIVWFGESVFFIPQACEQFNQADKILVVGTSLQVFPVAGLVNEASDKAEKVIVSLELEQVPNGYQFIQQPAASAVPKVVQQWLSKPNS
ncbi:SIR2 family NAD-dependent protein deacylase [Reinekea thalattae]|uniref:NAD-dependent protein deacylase n=1 Tax=Reinekea thalattae TaxID=2593301 RepID=A0A5C8Z4K9_9GAMM|nr:Sir2 family NAD-dependent protein deacetylase [Reinekea thalattae]TXR52111.1 NAD-dependent deacylase [Reinekea thalattae]